MATSRRDFDQAQREWELATSLSGATHLELEEALFGKVRLLAEQGRTADLQELVAELSAGVHGALDGRRLLNARSLLATAQLRDKGTTAAVVELRNLQDEARRLQDPALEAGISLNLATALRRRGGVPEIDEAIQLFERSCALYEKDGHLPGLAQARAALGGTLREEGQVALAIEALTSSLRLRERLGNHRGAASVRGMLGLALADRGELGAATVELEAAARELRENHGLKQAAELFEARLELARARLGRREQLHFAPLEFDSSAQDPRIALALARAAALRGRREEGIAAARAAREAAEKRGWRRSSEEARFLLQEQNANEGAPSELPDAQLFAAIRQDHGAEETLLRIARELGRRGRRDRAARAWLALAHRSEDAERSGHARSAAEREFRACARGLSEAETERLKRSLLSLPDPRPADLERQVAGSPRRRESELQALLDIQARLVDQEDLPSLLGKIVECALEIAGGERGFLLLEEEGELVFDTALDSRRGEDIAAPEVEVSRSVVRRALEVGAPLRLSNATADPLLGAAPSVTALELRSILCTPFEVQQGLRGVIYLDHRLRTGAFGDRAEELLLHLAGQAALAIRQVRRVAEIRRLNEKLSRRVIDAEADLQSARRALEDAGLTKSHKSGLVGRSAGIQGVRALLERAAPSRLPVLIQGESPPAPWPLSERRGPQAPETRLRQRSGQRPWAAACPCPHRSSPS
ncbi:MAG: GAF domain-containing protein, partial [Planctomycetota bacterium]